MTNKQTELLRRTFGIVLTIAIIVAGICFITGCVSIYSSGEQPYSREAVSQAFAEIAIPVYICLIFVIIGFVLDIFIPANKKKSRPEKNHKLILKLLVSQRNIDNCDADLKASIIRERKKRNLIRIMLCIILSISVLIFVIYACNGDNFTEDINASVINAMKVMIPCCIISLATAITARFLINASAKKEIELLKTLPKNEGLRRETESRDATPEKTVMFIRIVLIACAVGLIVYGFVSGGTADVLTKAVNICTECIGLG